MDVNLHCALEVPPGERVRDGGQIAVRPVGVDAVRLTGPDSPERLVTVMVLLAEEPAWNETGVAEMMKSIIVIEKRVE